MRRVKYYEFEGFIQKGQGPKIHNYIWVDFVIWIEAAAYMAFLFNPVVYVKRVWVMLVKPHHSTAAASVKNYFVVPHQINQCN